MALSKQRKVYVGLLALGVAALGVDRFLLASSPLGPSAAHAGVDAPGVPLGEPVGDTAGSARPSDAARDVFARRLRDRASQVETPVGSGRDAYLVPASWLRAADVPAPESASVEPASAAWADGLSVSSMVDGGESGIPGAVINGVLVRVGQSFDLDGGRPKLGAEGALRLASAEGSAVLLQGPGGSTATLELRGKDHANVRLNVRQGR